MILLTVIAVGLLSLSSISLRSSSSSNEISKARANARMALSIALGELQKKSGSDSRVTARADVLNASHPPVLGVWRSWEGTNHTASGATAGRPISPGSDYKAAKNSRFLSWLVSGPPSSLTDASSVPNLAPGNGKVSLVGAGSVGNGPGREPLQIHLSPSPIKRGNSHGTFAWWIGGENQKARLPKPYQPTNDTVAGWSVHRKSYAVADPKVFRMEALLTDSTPAHQAITLLQSDLIAPKQGELRASAEFFHDLSATAVGLLTNTATGGWRKDFSLLTENWNKLPKSNLPFFRVAPGIDLLASIPTTGNHRPDRSLLYPWASYRAAGIPIYEHGAVSSWENLKDWATLYKTMSASGTRITSRSYRIDSNNSNDNFNFLHRVRITPLLAPVLDRFGHTDLAYQVLFKESYPSWFYSIHQGATTMWERWNSYSHADGFGDAGMNSFNHYAYGAIGQWMHERIAGLAPDPAQPGYKHFFIQPAPGGSLTSARAELQTPYGKASSAWILKNGTLNVEAIVPPNTTATFMLPGRKPTRLAPGRHVLSHKLP
ncbi:MAG: hypothetical protein RLZZ245_1613 [Verrucomicrobiota bacterium]